MESVLLPGALGDPLSGGRMTQTSRSSLRRMLGGHWLWCFGQWMGIWEDERGKEASAGLLVVGDQRVGRLQY